MKKIVMVVFLVLFLVNFVYAVRINEIMYKPDFHQSYNEWIELYNEGSEEIDLVEFSLCGKNLVAGYVDRQGEIQNDGGLILEAGGFALITDGGSSGTEVYENFDVGPGALAIHVESATLCGGLTDTGKTLILEKGGETYEELTYSDNVEKGYSLEFKEGEFLKSQSIHGTPGEENSNSKGNDPNPPGENETENNQEGDEEIKNVYSIPKTNETVKIKEANNSPIVLTPKDIKTSGSDVSSGSISYSKYSIIVFCVLLVLLYMLK
ncbi:MAG: lamin tail domain-containing protein, partial [Nanoarchaeota archaeon]|nr:lamin tail domain-containing protein [Nanoarchaeota archaeon]